MTMNTQTQATQTGPQPRKYHAHFDCFSGAAGDMMLAACLDAADSLGHSLHLPLFSNPSKSANDAGITEMKESEKLLAQITHDLETGMPDLKGEFELTMKQVWRGMGSIAARKVDVKSVYLHEAAPVPGSKEDGVADSHSSDHEHKHEPKHDHQHEHKHAHQHQHGHYSHNHDSDKEHAHTHDHSNAHDHSHSHSHNHSHSHSHNHSHNHSHGHSHRHSHSHDHSHNDSKKLRNLPEITRMLQMGQSTNTPATPAIPPRVAELAIASFTALAHAEMHTHGAASINQVHFHEVGAVDSIVDTVGTLLGLFYLGVDLGDAGKGGNAGAKCAISCSRLPMGEGTVWTDHGLLPVPAPATLRLMMGMPTCPGPSGVDGITGELVTPTAAALLRVVTGVDRTNANGDEGGSGGSSFWRAKTPVGRPPNWTPRAVGLGAGTKDFEKHPNILRLILGESASQRNRSVDCNQVVKDGNRDMAESLQSVEEELGDAKEGKTTNFNVLNVVRLLYGSRCIKFNANQSIPSSLCRMIPSNIEKNKMATAQESPDVLCKKSTNYKPSTDSNLWDIHTLTHMQANIDDATPELLAYTIELLLKNGAIDAWVQPIVMKKGRPAHLLNCLCKCSDSNDESENIRSSMVTSSDHSDESRILEILFRHTTTLGIRIQRNILRAALRRKFVEVQLPYRENVRGGKVDVKVSSLKNDEVVSIKAEFDQCKVISEESGVPLKIVSGLAEKLAWEHIGI